MILPSVKDPHNCTDLRNLRQSGWNQMLGKMEGVLILYDRMRWKSDDINLLQGLQNAYSPPLCPPLIPLYFRTIAMAHWWCTLRLWSSVFGNAVGDEDWVNTEIHLEAGIRQLWNPTWRLRDGVNWDMYLENEWASEPKMHLKAVIKWTQICAWEPWVTEYGMHFEAVIERVGIYTWRSWSWNIGGILGRGWSGSDWSGGSQSRYRKSGGGISGAMNDGSWDSSDWLTPNCGNVENCVQQSLQRDWLGARDSRS